MTSRKSDSAGPQQQSNEDDVEQNLPITDVTQDGEDMDGFHGTVFSCVENAVVTLQSCARSLASAAYECTGIAWFQGLASPCVTVDGRQYRLLDKLAEGGFSFVYLVEDTETTMRYAMKLARCQTSEQIEQCRFEMGVYLELDHPNLISSLRKDFVKLSTDHIQQAAFVFPFYPHGTAQNALDRCRDKQLYFNEQECLKIVQGVAKGLSQFHTHEPPWAHRDIKPGNILLDEQKNPVLLDFGSTSSGVQPVNNRQELLRIQDQAEKNCSMPYRAPELFQPTIGSTVTFKSDIWSLGCTLYALAFGFSPFEVEWNNCDSPRLVTPTHLRVIGKWRFPSWVDTRFSKMFQDLITDMLRITPEERLTLEQLVSKIDGVNDAAD